jgi:hypothetical protein
LVMRNFGDQEDARTVGANKATLLGGESPKPEPAPPGSKAGEERAATPKLHPRVKRTSHVPDTNGAEKTAVVQPAPRKSVELIEGSKRRDVDIP